MLRRNGDGADSAATVTRKYQAMLTVDGTAGIAGSAPVGVLLMLLMLTGLLLVIVMLVVQLVTLYFTGALLPLEEAIRGSPRWSRQLQQIMAQA